MDLAVELILRELDFLPFELYKAKRIMESYAQADLRVSIWDNRLHEELISRSTGRSTQMMILAVVYAICGYSVSIHACVRNTAEYMVSDVEGWCHQLGFEGKGGCGWHGYVANGMVTHCG